MQIARSFWKVDRCLDMDQTMNSSFYYAQKMQMQNQGLSPNDMYSGPGNSQNMPSRIDLGSKGEPSQFGGDEKNNFLSPNRGLPNNYRQTSPRNKYDAQAGGLVKGEQKAMSRGLLGVMRKK